MSKNKLFDAAATGDTECLHELLEEDPFILDRVSYTCYNKTPLHVATMKGHLRFVQEILNLNRRLAQELDSQQSSALHLASAIGDLKIVKELLSAAPGMCMSRDFQGMNPIFLAAINGHLEVLEELFKMMPVAAQEKIDRGQTVLHLCVKHDQLEALKVLAPNLNDLVNEGDDDGDTILHLAVRNKQIEIITYLVGFSNIDMKVMNSKGQTVRDILKQSPAYTRNSEMREILRPGMWNSNKTRTQPVKWLDKKRETVMVVAILIATMAFQVGVTPPGGVWQQEDTLNDKDGNGLKKKAGESVLAYQDPVYFRAFIGSNTVAFVSSLSIILLLISGLPFRHRLFIWFLILIMWITITATAFTYAISVRAVTPGQPKKSLDNFPTTVISVWFGVIGILIVGNTIRLIDKGLENKGSAIWRLKGFRNYLKSSYVWRPFRSFVNAPVQHNQNANQAGV